MSRVTRTASAAGRRSGADAVTSMTLPPGASRTVAAKRPPSTSAFSPATSTAASAGVTVPRTSTVPARTERPSSGRSSASLTRGSVTGRGASPQAAKARPAARRRTRERTPSMLSAQPYVERTFLAGAAARGHRDPDLELEAVRAREPRTGRSVQRDLEGAHPAGRGRFDVAADAAMADRDGDL